MGNKLERVAFDFRNELKDDVQIVTLSGVVEATSWFNDDTINAKLVDKILDESDTPLVIRLNSPGGDVFEGIEIYNALKSSARHVTVEVTALAASAASIIAMGADVLLMNLGSSLMIHEASTIAWGNKKDIQKVLNALETIDQSLVDIYCHRTGKSEEEIKDLLLNETWFTAQEAVDNGFASGVNASVDPIEINVNASNLSMSKDMLISAITQSEDLSGHVENKKIKIFGGNK